MRAATNSFSPPSFLMVKLIKNGDDLIITHGNGPQVGNLLLQHLAADSEKNPAFPLDSLVAMTEGSIGYWLQNALQNALLDEGIDKNVASVVTQVVVDKNDPAFVNLSKPIGPFYSEEEAKRAERLSKRMPAVVGVRSLLHQNRLTLRKLTQFVLF